MPRRCSICTNVGRDVIDRALIAGEPLRHIAGRHDVAPSSVHRHRHAHLPARLVRAAQRHEQSQTAGLHARICDLERLARRLLDKADKKKDYRTALAAVRELGRLIELTDRIDDDDFSPQEVRGLVEMLGRAIKRHVRDREIQRAIFDEFSRLCHDEVIDV